MHEPVDRLRKIRPVMSFLQSRFSEVFCHLGIFALMRVYYCGRGDLSSSGVFLISEIALESNCLCFVTVKHAINFSLYSMQVRILVILLWIKDLAKVDLW